MQGQNAQVGLLEGDPLRDSLGLIPESLSGHV